MTLYWAINRLDNTRVDVLRWTAQTYVSIWCDRIWTPMPLLQHMPPPPPILWSEFRRDPATTPTSTPLRNAVGDRSHTQWWRTLPWHRTCARESTTPNKKSDKVDALWSAFSVYVSTDNHENGHFHLSEVRRPWGYETCALQLHKNLNLNVSTVTSVLWRRGQKRTAKSGRRCQSLGCSQ